MKQGFQETLGLYLRRQRESRQIALPDLSRTTRISLPFLKALEEDNLDFFSQHEFIPGFLKLYAGIWGWMPRKCCCATSSNRSFTGKGKPFSNCPFSWIIIRPSRGHPGESGTPGKNSDERSFWESPSLWPWARPVHSSTAQRDRDPATPGPALSTNIGQEQPGEKRAALFSAGPAAKETLPSSGPDRPEINVPAKESKDLLKAEPPAKSLLAEESKVKVIGNRDSRRYHLPGMKYYDKVLAYHRVEFNSEEEAIRAGYHKASQ